MSLILDGKTASSALKLDIQKQVGLIVGSGKRPPHLAAILVGNNGASETYVASKERSCKEVGFDSTVLRLKENITQQALITEIDKINKNTAIDGLIVQLPLPKHIDETIITDAINPDIDVDGFHTYNAGKLVKGMDTFIPATPFGIVKLLAFYKIETAGKNVVIIGRSMIVGKPMSILLSGNNKDYGNATVTLCHSKTINLVDFTLKADIIIVALGKPYFLNSEMVKQGAVVIDVGITRIKDSEKKSGFKIAGDTDFESLKNKCSAITPVPGGVGLMTILGLLENTLKSYLQKNG